MTATASNNVILVPTDFTAIGQNAIEYAVKAAEKLDHSIVLLHVINRETKAKLGKENTPELVSAKLQQHVDSVAQYSDVKVTYLYSEGSIFDVIQEVARELNPKFLVLGTHGKKGLQHLFGSYALKVISHSPSPVIVVQEKKVAAHGFKKIVFPIGVHTEARQQVLYAIISNTFFGGEILVYQQCSHDPGEKSKLQIISSQIEEKFQKNNVKYSLTKSEETSDFGAQLINFAIVNNADMIIMMTDSVIDNPSFDNSSWSEKLMFNSAQIPVLCINPVYLGEVRYSL